MVGVRRGVATSTHVWPAIPGQGPASARPFRPGSCVERRSAPDDPVRGVPPRFEILLFRIPRTTPRGRHVTLQVRPGPAEVWYQNCTFTVWSSSCNYIAFETVIFQSSTFKWARGGLTDHSGAGETIFGQKIRFCGFFRAKHGSFLVFLSVNVFYLAELP